MTKKIEVILTFSVEAALAESQLAAMHQEVSAAIEKYSNEQLELQRQMAADLKAIRAQGEAIAKYLALLSKAVYKDSAGQATLKVGSD